MLITSTWALEEYTQMLISTKLPGYLYCVPVRVSSPLPSLRAKHFSISLKCNNIMSYWYGLHRSIRFTVSTGSF